VIGADEQVLETFRAEREAIYRTLTARRRELGWSQADLGNRMGTSQSAVCEFERGKVEPRVDTLQRWAHALGYDLALLLDGGQRRVESASLLTAVAGYQRTLTGVLGALVRDHERIDAALTKLEHGAGRG